MYVLYSLVDELISAFWLWWITLLWTLVYSCCVLYTPFFSPNLVYGTSFYATNYTSITSFLCLFHNLLILSCWIPNLFPNFYCYNTNTFIVNFLLSFLPYFLNWQICETKERAQAMVSVVRWSSRKADPFTHLWTVYASTASWKRDPFSWFPRRLLY